MGNYLVIALLAFAASLASPAEAGPLDDALAPLRREYEEAFNAKDVEKLVRLFAGDALYFGARENELKVGAADLRAYFSHLNSKTKVKLGEQAVIQAAPDVLLSSGYAEFIMPDGKPIPYQISWAAVKIDGQWRIAQAHMSVLPQR